MNANANKQYKYWELLLLKLDVTLFLYKSTGQANL